MLSRIKRWLQGHSLSDSSGVPGQRDGAGLNILMVCSGNICRSPTAEAVLRAKLHRAGFSGVKVDSAGTHGFHISEAPDPRAQAAAKRRGYDLSRLRARPMGEADFGHFQWLMAMDHSHLAWIQQRMPQQRFAQTQLLMAHARTYKAIAEVPDPYYGGPEGFERVLDLVEDACDGVVDLIRHQQKLA